MDAPTLREDGEVGGAPKPSPGKSISRTVTGTISGEHEHTIVGYSLIKGIGDGEPIASERFTVGGLEWVLLFYPDGKRSATDHGGHVPVLHLPHHEVARIERRQANAQENGGGAGPAPPANDGGAGPDPPANGGDATPRRAANIAGPAGQGDAADDAPAGDGYRRGDGSALAAAGEADRPAGPTGGGVPGWQALEPLPPRAQGGGGGGGLADRLAQAQAIARVRAQAAAHAAQQQAEHSSDYCALFVALIGEGEQPLGVVSTADGRVVRAFHRFQLVDQSGRGHDVVKGRRREQGAVKISCSRSDPTARNCHGYRKFVKRGVLEDPMRGLLVNDTLVVRYRIELVVSSGGALSRASPSKPPVPCITVPPLGLGNDLARLLSSGDRSDVVFRVDDTSFPAHRVVLSARSPVFAALLSGPMREGTERDVVVEDVLPAVFRALLHFSYTDTLPNDLQGAAFDVPMAQHLLAAADRYGLFRLRSICEQRLCETVHVDTVATTLALAEQNNARELKRVCLSYVASHLQDVLATEGYAYMIEACPQLQNELLRVLASAIQPNRADGPSAGPALSVQPVLAPGVNAARRAGAGAGAGEERPGGAAASRARPAGSRWPPGGNEGGAAGQAAAGGGGREAGGAGAGEAVVPRGRADASRWPEGGRDDEASVEGPNRRVRPRRD